ncbi:MAG: 5'/3'-nucleotidase SurE [Anaerolineae bacterium]|nr:5'/3'-nucleotidase SurE [Anaerolineae bacterium]
MPKSEQRQILLVNDDGIHSPGLWAAAAALSRLGYVTVVAPREQQSSTGRSLPIISDGKIEPARITVGGDEWEVYAVGGSPAQAVLHAVVEIMPRRPDLVVSGINYGENMGTSITISGTVGAAIEAASFGIPALAISLELVNIDEYLDNSPEIDFSTAAHFTYLFGEVLLDRQLPSDVHLLKVDVPHDATPATPWRITRLASHRYYTAIATPRQSWDQPGAIYGQRVVDLQALEKDSDIYALAIDRQVSVTPLSLDMTSRVDFDALCRQMQCKNP